MAERFFWTIEGGKIKRGLVTFKWESGTSLAQRKRSCLNMLKVINWHTGLNPMDISSASPVEFYSNLSAFKLMFDTRNVEQIYQGSKIFKGYGQASELYTKVGRDAKQTAKYLHSQYELVGFNWDGVDYPLEPTTVFYDYLYIQALLRNFGDKLNLDDYDVFADVQLGQGSNACQARAVCEYKLLKQTNLFDVLDTFESFLEWHKNHVEEEFKYELQTGRILKLTETKFRYVGNEPAEDLCKRLGYGCKQLGFATYELIE